MLSETLNAYNSETDRDIGMNQKATRRVRSLLSFERRQNFLFFFISSHLSYMKILSFVRYFA